MPGLRGRGWEVLVGRNQPSAVKQTRAGDLAHGTATAGDGPASCPRKSPGEPHLNVRDINKRLSCDASDVDTSLCGNTS